MPSAGTAYVDIAPNFKGFYAGMAAQSGPVSRQGNRLGRTFGLAVAGGAAAAAAKSVSLAVDFEKSMRNVNSIAQLNEKQFGKLNKRVLELAGPTAQAPKTLADGLYDLVSSGFNANQSIQILNKSARAATAGLTDTATSTKAVAAVLNAYHLRAGAAGKVSDQLFQTVNRGVITFEELAQNIGDVLPFAASLGVGLDQVGASISTMTKAGISAPETMTRIKSIMQALLKPSKQMSAALKDQGYESGEALIKAKGFQGALEVLAKTTDGSKQKMAALFPNVRALGGALALTGDNAKGAEQDVKGLQKTSGATAKALSQQSKSVAFQWQRLKAQAQVLGIEFGSKLLPALSGIVKMLSDPHLDVGQKFDRLVQTISQAVSQAIPKIADVAAKAAPQVAGAFFKGFVNSSVWGRLLVGGLLLSKFGAFGSRGGTAAAEGFKGRFKAGLKGLGIASLISGAVGATQGDGAGAHLQNAVSGLTFGIVPPDLGPNLKKTADLVAGLRKQINGLSTVRQPRALADTAATLRKLANTKIGRNAFGADALRQAAAAMDKTGQAISKVLNNFDQLEHGATTSMRRVRKATSDNWRLIRSTLGIDSDKGVHAAERNFQAGFGAIKHLLDSHVISHRKALREINNLYRQYLQEMGFTPKSAANITRGTHLDKHGNVIAGNVSYTGGREEGTAGPGHQRGGPIHGGKPHGDSIPAMLERGEYVLNRKAVKKIGRHVLDRINFGEASRFQQGGLAGIQPGIRRAAQAVMGRFPLQVTSTTGGGHAPGSYHYSGQAVDLAAAPEVMYRASEWIKSSGLYRSLAEGIHNPNLAVKFGKLFKGAGPFGGVWANHLSHIHMAVLGAALGKFGGGQHIGRFVVNGPGGPLKAISQRGLDTAVGAANRILDAAASAGGGGDVAGPVAGGGMSKAAIKKLWVAAGGDPSMANLMAAIALAESGGNPSIVNSIGATGLWQIHPGGSQYLDPLTNARTAVMKLRTQGLGAWEAYTNGSYRQYLQKGGLVGAIFQRLQGGGAPHAVSGHVQGGRRTLADRLRGTLKAVSELSPKLSNGRVKGLVDAVKKIGLPAKVRKDLAKLGGDANVFGEYADRAGQLTDTGAITDALNAELTRRGGNFSDADQQSFVDSMLGRVNGKTQVEWLGDQLTALFKWRNRIIEAQQIVAQRRAQVAKLIEQARTRLKTVTDAYNKAQDRRRKLAHQLEQARKKPKANKSLIKSLKGRIDGIDKDQKVRNRVRDTLKDRILPALTGRSSGLKDTAGNLTSNLTDVQGLGSPMGVLRTLPPIGVLGGTIFDVQKSLQDLGAEKLRATDTGTDTGTTSTDDSGRADLLQQLLDQSHLQEQVLSRQYDVFKGFPPFGGSFGGGGTVPGPVGAARTAIVHGGERVLSVDEQAGQQPIYVVVQDGAVDPNKIKVIARSEVQTVTRRAGRRGSNPLPGRGGG